MLGNGSATVGKMWFTVITVPSSYTFCCSVTQNIECFHITSQVSKFTREKNNFRHVGVSAGLKSLVICGHLHDKRSLRIKITLPNCLSM